MTRPTRIAAACGAGAWGAALIGWSLHWHGVGAVAAAAVLVATLGLGNRLPVTWVIVAVVAVGAATSGALAAQRTEATISAEVPSGLVDVVGLVADEPVPGNGGLRFVLSGAVGARGADVLPAIAVEWGGAAQPTAGDRVRVRGDLHPTGYPVRGDPVAGTLRAGSLEIVARAAGPLHRLAALLRNRVDSVLVARPGDPALALLAGFLIGDTVDLPPRDMDALRAAGLSHFVAVSGSNVALFLAAWWLLLVPLAGPRTRAVAGLVGIVVFVIVTRWEPSVVRAAVMLSLVLVGRIAGVAIEPGVALGGGVAGLLLVAGDLAVSVGFQLSVAATVGVMVGVRYAADRRPRWMWSVLAATAGAQLMVAPLALVQFGRVPLLAPVWNLLAAPLVTLATGLGGGAVALGGTPLLDLARIPASAMLSLARLASGSLQLDAIGFAVVVVLGVAMWARALRVVASAALVGAIAWAIAPVPVLGGAMIVALDVGQGDAIVVRDGAVVMLVDGGRDPSVLDAALGRHRIDSIDILVVTHGDADHVGGLVEILDTVSVHALWVPAFGEPGELLTGLAAHAARRGIPVEKIAAGRAVAVGRIQVTVLGPQRRYKGDNDGAIVLWVEAGARTALLPSDLEAIAQVELPVLRPEILLVPHHGAGTTDRAWLAATVGPIAVISVGRNSYGHPDPGTMAVLNDREVAVFTTMERGDVLVPLLPP